MDGKVDETEPAHGTHNFFVSVSFMFIAYEVLAHTSRVSMYLIKKLSHMLPGIDSIVSCACLPTIVFLLLHSLDNLF